jgi:murein DD-endopeptidase MepM/ murein hydrolase activator NlpD
MLLLVLLGCTAAARQPDVLQLSAQQVAQLQRAAMLLQAFEQPVQHYAWPVAGRVSSPFGWRNISVGGNRQHGGVDLAAPPGTPVAAAKDGTVTQAGWLGAYGYAVYLDHGDGSETRYAHLSTVNVVPGQHVRQGGLLGQVGSSGAASGPHLHFEIRLSGVAVDPLPLLPGGAAQGAQTPR